MLIKTWHIVPFLMTLYAILPKTHCSGVYVELVQIYIVDFKHILYLYTVCISLHTLAP